MDGMSQGGIWLDIRGGPPRLLAAPSLTAADQCCSFGGGGCEVDYIFPQKIALTLLFVYSVSSSSIDICCCCSCSFSAPPHLFFSSVPVLHPLMLFFSSIHLFPTIPSLNPELPLV